MSRPNNRKAQPGGLDEQTLLMFTGIALAVIVLGSLSAAVHLGHLIAGTGDEVPGNPIVLAIGLAKGSVAWPGTAAWVVLVGIVLGLIGLAAGVGRVLWRRSKGRSRVDSAARYMGRGDDIKSLGTAHALDFAQRAGVRTSSGKDIDRSNCGLIIADAVISGQPLVGSYEDLHLDIHGPRTGKTTCRAIPALVEHDGPAMATSNKRDLVDATRDVRAASGRVWVFDPQGICGEDPNGPDAWWWNPLSYVTDEVRAAKMAEHFATGSRDANARTDAYFDNAGQNLLAGLLLAAALDKRPITDVYVWLTRPGDDTAARILFKHEFTLTGHQVKAANNAPDKQRAGVFATAEQMAACLTNRKVAAWVTPRAHDQDDTAGQDEEKDAARPARRRHLDVHAFVRSGDTLYSLSKEGKGTAGPLVTALTVAVIEAAEELAATSRGGRLAVPLLGVLDEAANVCRWKDLPGSYSHFGSKGIVLMTILQSWAQGEAVWGENGMKALWSAANIRVYGGGVSDTTYLEDMSKLIGDYDKATSSVTIGRGQRSVSHQLQPERILDVAALGALPKGRAVVLSSGNRPGLARTRPWMRGPYAEAIRASIAAHDPQAEQTLRQADQELAAVEAAEQARTKGPQNGQAA